MTNDGFHTYTYDAEGRITAVDGGSTATYVYDALNQRVRAVVGSAATEYVFNAAGQRVSEWNGTTHAQLKGKYYWGGGPLAYYTTAASGEGAGAHFEHQDWLGTERLRTTYNGGVEGTFISLPWGDGQSSSGSDYDANHYATLDHDTESDTDHAQFRQYSNAQGRWLSPDPYGGSYDAASPQSFNRYAYAGNNPLSGTDPTGLYLPFPGVCDASIDPAGCGGGDPGWGPTDGSSPVYYMDGLQTSASTVAWLEGVGAAVQCPLDKWGDPLPCSGFNSAGQYMTYQNTEEGPTYTSNANQLSYITVPGGPGSSTWVINWQVNPPSAQDGYIIQMVVITPPPDAPVQSVYWEAWPVPAGSNITDTGALNPDDIFSNNPGTTVTTTAGFYPGYTLPTGPGAFIVGNSSTAAGQLPSTTLNPNLPQATSYITRTWTAP